MNPFVPLHFRGKPTVLQSGDVVGLVLGNRMGSTTNIMIVRDREYIQFETSPGEMEGGMNLIIPNTPESHRSIIRLLSAVTGLKFTLHTKDTDPINSRWICE